MAAQNITKRVPKSILLIATVLLLMELQTCESSPNETIARATVTDSAKGRRETPTSLLVDPQAYSESEYEEIKREAAEDAAEAEYYAEQMEKAFEAKLRQRYVNEMPSWGRTHPEDMGPLEVVFLVHVVDGDTIAVRYQSSTKSVRVRLLDVGAPEIDEPHGSAARLHLLQLLTDDVEYLYLDKCETDSDEYGRFLRYVHTDKWLFVNARMVLDGYAEVLLVDPNYCFAAEMYFLEDDAQENKRGIWAD